MCDMRVSQDGSAGLTVLEHGTEEATIGNAGGSGRQALSWLSVVHMGIAGGTSLQCTNLLSTISLWSVKSHFG